MCPLQMETWRFRQFWIAPLKNLPKNVSRCSVQLHVYPFMYLFCFFFLMNAGLFPPMENVKTNLDFNVHIFAPVYSSFVGSTRSFPNIPESSPEKYISAAYMFLIFILMLAHVVILANIGYARPRLQALTIYTESLEILVGKWNGSYHSIWNSSEIIGYRFNQCMFSFPCELSNWYQYILWHFRFAFGQAAALNIYT